MRIPRTLLLAALLALAAGVLARPLHDFSDADVATDALVAGYALPGASLRLATGTGEVHRRHVGAYDETTRVPIASASKWLSALTLARLVEAGELRWDSQVGDYFPDAPAAVRGITVDQLFSHTSGIATEEAACLSARGVTLQQCAQEILALPLAWAPGSVFAYGGNSMQVAGAMAERATGRSWDAIFQAEMVAPLGLTGTDWTAAALRDGYVPNANPRIAGGARSTLADYSRVVDMVLAGGEVGGEAFLSPQTLALMARDRSLGLPIADSPDSRTDQGYGLGQWVEERDVHGATTRVSSPGAFGFTPWVDWRQGSNGVLLVLGDGREMRADINVLQQACLDALEPLRELQEAAPPAPPSPRTTPARLDATRRAH
ncbi:MAG: beta-lactamase family protein [Rhizobium sp.]|nr:beta-lactamase family protein [Rhizobium sp.]